MNIASLILAAGKGTRMKSKLPKVLHKVGGKAMVERVLETVQSIGTNRDVVIVGFGGDAVQNYLGNRAEFVRQEEQNGTGHAVKMAQPVLGDYDGTILLLCGDTPLVTKESLEALLEEHKNSGAAATILTAHMPDPTGYGRIIRNEEGSVVRIVEQKDGKPEELAVQEVNTGMYAFDSKKLWPCLDQLSDDNAQGELYITDVVGILVNGGDKVSAYMTKDFEESLGVNSRLQLAEAEAILKHRKNIELMTAGVTIIDPANTYVAPEVKVGADTILYPGTILEGDTVIGERCEIGPHTRLTNVKVGNDTIIHFTYGHDCEVKDGVDANSIAKEMLDKVNPIKWICVGAEKVYATSSGDVVCLVMASEEWAKPIYESFKSLAGTIGQEYERQGEPQYDDFPMDDTIQPYEE